MLSETEDLTAAHKYLDEKGIERSASKRSGDVMVAGAGSVLPLWYRISLLQQRQAQS